MLQLYQNIKSRRIELGMTQTELAHKTGYADKSMIAKIESGRVDLSQSKIMLFADALEMPASDLMGDDGIDLMSDMEKDLLSNFRKLSQPGKEYIMQTMMLAVQTYGKKNSAVSDMEAAR